MKKKMVGVGILLGSFILLAIAGIVGIRFIRQAVIKKELRSTKDPAIMTLIRHFSNEKQASKIQVQDATVQMKKAFEYLKEDKNEEALAIFEAILANPKEPRTVSAAAQLFKGISYMRMARVDFLGLDPDIPKDETAREQARKGIEAFEIVLSEYQDFPQGCAQALYEIGCAYYYSLDEKEKGREYWQRLIDTYPENSFASLAKFELGQITDEALLKLADSPNFFSKENILFITAVKYQKEGDLEKAAEYFKQAVVSTLNPEAMLYVRARKQLKRIEEQMK